jgi:hypothetical protein
MYVNTYKGEITAFNMDVGALIAKSQEPIKQMYWLLTGAVTVTVVENLPFPVLGIK